VKSEGSKVKYSSLSHDHKYYAVSCEKHHEKGLIDVFRINPTSANNTSSTGEVYLERVYQATGKLRMPMCLSNHKFIYFEGKLLTKDDDTLNPQSQTHVGNSKTTSNDNNP
jgi:hypothetical protein